MNAAPVTTVAAEINRLHEEAKRGSFASREALHGALVAAWRAGHLLIVEIRRVFQDIGTGAWLFWVKANFRGTARTAQRYMRLAHTVADEAFFHLAERRRGLLHLP